MKDGNSFKIYKKLIKNEKDVYTSKRKQRKLSIEAEQAAHLVKETKVVYNSRSYYKSSWGKQSPKLILSVWPLAWLNGLLLG